MKDDLTEMTKKNTSLLERLVACTEERQNLEETLNASQSSVVRYTLLRINYIEF